MLPRELTFAYSEAASEAAKGLARGASIPKPPTQVGDAPTFFTVAAYFVADPKAVSPALPLGTLLAYRDALLSFFVALRPPCSARSRGCVRQASDFKPTFGPGIHCLTLSTVLFDEAKDTARAYFSFPIFDKGWWYRREAPQMAAGAVEAGAGRRDVHGVLDAEIVVPALPHVEVDVGGLHPVLDGSLLVELQAASASFSPAAPSTTAAGHCCGSCKAQG